MTPDAKLVKVRAKAREMGLSHTISVSTRKGKKFVVVVDGREVHFGQLGAEDFWDHRDPERRRRYLARARGIRDGKGRLTHTRTASANFWSINLLW
jgi:hypothetical protein